MLQYKDIFKGREEEIVEKRLYNCVSASFIANPGYNYCLKFILDDVTRKDYFSSRGRDDINLPTIVLSTVSDDGRTITIECEPRENPNLWGVNSRMICKGIISVNSEGIIKVSEVKATSLSSDEYEIAKQFMPQVTENPSGPIVYLCERTSFAVNSNGEQVAVSSGFDCYSKDNQDDDELRQIVNRKYNDLLSISKPVNVSINAPMVGYKKV